MLDMKLVRKDAASIEKKLQTKDPTVSLTKILELDTSIRELKTVVEEMKSQRNAVSKEIGLCKQKGEDTSALFQKVSGLGDKITELDRQIAQQEEALAEESARLPNIPSDKAKISLNVADNEVVREVGKKPTFSFPFKHHLELNESLKLFDFERGAKISGSGWPVYTGLGARLEWALINFMIDTHVKAGFTQWILPLLVRPDMMYGSAQLPKFYGQFYQLEDVQHPLYLIPTGEVALNALHCDEILSEESLPLKYITYTPCFRREAGAAGRQERGLIRTHQFNKVEMFAFCKPADSERIFEEFVASAENILQLLGLHYRVMRLVTGDMSFAASDTIDLEVFLPGQDRYYEVSSVSNCTDFQSRRSKVRFRDSDNKTQLVHTLNGSGLATSRLMVALLENNQRADGSVVLPEILSHYLGGITELKPC